jgi:hypothetical protein
MKKNMGTLDRIIRAIIVVIIAVLYFSDKINGTLAIILGIVAVAFFLTSVIGWCPTWAIFGLSTRKKDDSENKKE